MSKSRPKLIARRSELTRLLPVFCQCTYPPCHNFSVIPRHLSRDVRSLTDVWLAESSKHVSRRVHSDTIIVFRRSKTVVSDALKSRENEDQETKYQIQFNCLSCDWRKDEWTDRSHSCVNDFRVTVSLCRVDHSTLRCRGDDATSARKKKVCLCCSF